MEKLFTVPFDRKYVDEMEGFSLDEEKERKKKQIREFEILS